MSRPTKEQVDQALRSCNSDFLDESESFMPMDGMHSQWDVDVLAAEVRALRDELDELRGAYDVLLRGEAYQAACSLLNASVAREVGLHATIARVEALPAKWREARKLAHGSTYADGIAATLKSDAEDLETALKGGA